jgi:hypothetical protein
VADPQFGQEVAQRPENESKEEEKEGQKSKSNWDSDPFGNVSKISSSSKEWFPVKVEGGKEVKIVGGEMRQRSYRNVTADIPFTRPVKVPKKPGVPAGPPVDPPYTGAQKK